MTRWEKEKRAKFVREMLAVFFVFLCVVVVVVGFPRYQVWYAEMAGRAELVKATENRKIKIETAMATEQAARYLANAEIVQAEGVAKANSIIGDSLKKNEAYLRYLWIKGLHDGSSEVIYIPTEGNMPILEATRLDN